MIQEINPMSFDNPIFNDVDEAVSTLKVSVGLMVVSALIAAKLIKTTFLQWKESLIVLACISANHAVSSSQLPLVQSLSVPRFL